jgi:phasin family protein
MAQKKTAAAKTARKKIELPAKVSAKLPAKLPAAAPLLAAAEATRRAEQPAESVAPARQRPAPTAKAPTAKAPTAKAPTAKVPTAKAAKPKAPKAEANTPKKDFGDLAAVGQENIEACVKCGSLVAKGVEALGTEVMSFTQANIEADIAAAKDIMTAKSLQEAVALQNDFVRARFERMTSETTKLGELSMRLASMAMEPLRSRFDANTANTWKAFRPLGM